MVFSLVIISVLFLFDNRYYIIINIIAYILSESELSDKIKAPHGQINLLSNLIRFLETSVKNRKIRIGPDFLTTILVYK